MHELELFHPEIALLLYGIGLIVGIVWLVFPFIVMSRLGSMLDHLRGMEEHLNAIRSNTDTKLPPPKQANSNE
jgi:type III secretory pathway component EscT